MDLTKNGKLLRDLRREKGLTQKALAEKLGVVAKTISKWETGHGFPDTSLLSSLADELGVSERSLLLGGLAQNKTETGNVQRTKFYVCPYCGSLLQGVGDFQVSCCGKTLKFLSAKPVEVVHAPIVSEIENDFYFEFPHEMTKPHHIVFVAYIGVDRVTTIRLYPEQDCAIRMPKAYVGKILFYCNQHGLFECRINARRKNRNI
jgi:transcriptional regulator with XRE-family HTH domain/desulfoferrodoxin (superoxide reductase-like protein)